MMKAIDLWRMQLISLQESETIAFQWVSRNGLANMRKDELVTERMQKSIAEIGQKTGDC